MGNLGESKQSKTVKVETTLGSAYIIKVYDNGNLSSLIVNVSKVGSDARALSEAFGRLVTLCLESKTGEEIAKELIGIKSSRGGKSIPTLPQAIGEVLCE